MGVFDFVRDVGAKVGIGKSTDERKAEDAAEAAAEKAADRAEKAAEAAQERASAKAAKERVSDIADKAKQALADKKASAKKAARVERFAEYKKSNELEKYVSELGIDMSGINIKYDDGTAYIEGAAADQATKERIILAVGNAEGVGKVDEEMTVAEVVEQAEFHTVAAGDTLWAVAEKVYGDGNRYTEIFEANKPMLSDPDLIFPGQVLRCPK